VTHHACFSDYVVFTIWYRGLISQRAARLAYYTVRVEFSPGPRVDAMLMRC
jgi:hypothetical protein